MPPKLPGPSTKKVPPVMLIVPSPVTSPPLTVMLAVPAKIPAVTVRSPPINMPLVTVFVPVESMITLLKAFVAPMPPAAILAEPPLKVTVPLPAVKVPKFVQFPATLILAAVPATKVPLVSVRLLTLRLVVLAPKLNAPDDVCSIVRLFRELTPPFKLILPAPPVVRS